ncbi:MAG TPA: MarR family transcriptional regulator [Actinomycetes bacterium]|nr:MarR family transcriptional regulator [Actinomycetes bacterium]
MPSRENHDPDPIAEAHRLWVEHGWGDAADGMAAITSLMRAHQIALSRVEAVLKPYDISFARYEVLMLLFLSRRRALPMRVIGSRLQVHQTSVTNAVDRLEEARLVARTPHPTDRRATLVEITSEGVALAREATDELNSTVFADPGLSPSAVSSLVRLLRQLRKDAGDF